MNLPPPSINPVFLQEPPSDLPLNLVELEDPDLADDLADRFNPFDPDQTDNKVPART